MSSSSVDVCGSLSAGWNEFVLSSAKFADKKDRLLELSSACDGALAAGSSLRFTPATSEVASSLTKMLRDANLIVVGEAIKCVLCLARGCGREFAPVAKDLLPPLCALLKEKKTNILLPAHAVLDLLWDNECVDLDAIWEQLEIGLNASMAKLRLENLVWVARCMQAAGAKSKVSAAAGKTLAETVFKMLADSDAEVRAQAMTTLAAIITIIGRKAVTAQMQKLELTDAKKAQKLDGMVGAGGGAAAPSAASSSGAGDDAKADGAPPAPAARPATSAGSRSNKKHAPSASSGSLTSRPSTASSTSSSASSASAVSASSASLPTAAPAAAASAASAAPTAAASAAPAKPRSGTMKRPTAAASSSSAASADVVVPVLSYEDSQAQLTAHPGIGGETIALILSKKWNETVEGMQKLQEQVCALPPAELQAILPATFFFLAKSPSFKPFNVQVSKSMYELLPVLSSLQTPFPSSLLLLTLPDLFNKVSDKKFADGITEVLLAFCEAMSPKVLLAEWLAVGERESKNLKSLEASLALIPRLLEEFGVGVFDVNVLIDAAKQASNHVQLPVRNQAIPILRTIYAQTGTMLKELMLNGLKPATATALEAEMASMGPVNASSFVAKRSVRGQSSQAKINVDDVIPRTDISDKITESLLSKLNDDGWKLRKEAIEEVQAILAAANHRIAAKDGGLLDALKLRLLDNNKNIAKDALALLSTLIADMGSPILKWASKLVPPMLTALGDQKTFVKAEASRALEAWLELSGLQSIVKHLPKVLDPANAGRQEALSILLARLPAGPIKSLDGVSKFDLSDLVTPILSLCVDKVAEVRTSSERVLEYVVANQGFDAVMEQTKEMKRATVLQLMGTMEKYRYTTQASMQQQQGAGAGGAAASSAVPSLPLDSIGGEELVRPSTAPPKKTALALKKPAVSGSATSREIAAPAAPSATAAAAEGGNPFAEKKHAILMRKSRMSTLPAKKSAAPLATAAASAASTIESLPEDGGAGAFPGDSSSASPSTLLKKLDMHQKRLRVSKDSKRVRGLYREYSKDEIEELDQICYTLVSDELYASLFHPDFQKQVQAIDSISKELTNSYESVLSISDLLLKYCAWRMMDANTTLLATMLPFISKLIAAFDAKSYKLTDGEAANILPSLVEKSFGHNTARFRTDTKDILLACCSIHPIAKVFSFVVAGFESKNKRVQSECVELAGSMLSKHGLALCDPKKLLPQIATMVGASDTNVRNAALSALSNVYTVSGEAMWTYLGRGTGKDIVPQKQMAMIEERMKRVKQAGPVGVGPSAPIAATAAASSSASAAAPSNNWGDESAPVTSVPSASIAAPAPVAAAAPLAVAPAAAAVAAPAPSSSPTSTPRKSMLPGSAGGASIMMKKKVGGVTASPLRNKHAQTMKPAQFAQLSADYLAMQASAHELNVGHSRAEGGASESAIDPADEKPAVVPAKIQHSPAQTHQRYHSNAADYAHALAAESADPNLPVCFSLELDPLVPTSPPTSPPIAGPFRDSAAESSVVSIPSRAAAAASSAVASFSSPVSAAAAPAGAGGVAQSEFLSDTLIVLSEPSVEQDERIEALSRMTELIRKQGPSSIVQNEETVIYVLLTELSNSFTISSSGLVKVQRHWNNAAMSAILQLVSQRAVMAVLPEAQGEQLLDAMFQHMSEPALVRSPACTELINAANQCVITILEMLPRTRALTLLFQLLRQAMLSDARKRQVELIAKCLSKVHKAMAREGTVGVDIPVLLHSLEQFLSDIDPTLEQYDNGAIKTMWSVIDVLVKQEGQELGAYMGAVAPESRLAQYLSELLDTPIETLMAAAAAAAAAPAQPPAVVRSASALVSPTSKRAIEIHASPKLAQSGTVTPTRIARSSSITGSDAPAGPASSGRSSPASAPSEPAEPTSEFYRAKFASLQSRATAATQSPLPMHSPPLASPPSSSSASASASVAASSVSSGLPAPGFSSPSPNHASSSTGSAAGGLPSPSFSSPSASGKPASSLEAIRARFNAGKTLPAASAASADQENKNITNAPQNSAPATALPSKLAAPQVYAGDAAATGVAADASAAPATSSTSTLLALRARVAAMNKKK